MTEKPPSARRQIAERFADFIIANDLANPFGGEVDQSPDKRYYTVDMSIPRLLDGTVRVYGPKFILLTFVGPLATIGGQFAFDSEENAMDFMRKYLVEHNTEAALAIPVRQQRSK